jgi:DegV family protein with EDD domain
MLIVTDGAVDVDPALASSELLRHVPGELAGVDGPLTVNHDDFWSGLRRGHYPSTSPPTVSSLLNAYEQPGLIIGLHVSAQLSATMQRAQEAAARAHAGVSVVDTGSLSVGAGLIVSEVHRAAREQAASSLVELTNALPSRLHTFALVQHVSALRASDRAGLLPKEHLKRDHPLVLAVRGRVVPLAQPRNRHGALNELARHLRHRSGPAPYAWALGHGDADDAGSIVHEFSQIMGQAPAFVTMLDPTVGVHLGPDSLVVGVLSDPSESVEGQT